MSRIRHGRSCRWRCALHRAPASRQRVGRDGGIRTHNPLLPKQVRFQIAPRPGGGDDGSRTHDLLFAKQVLCQLSYVPEVASSYRREPTSPPPSGDAEIGVTDGPRTRNLSDHNAALYRLSYGHNLRPRGAAMEAGVRVARQSPDYEPRWRTTSLFTRMVPPDGVEPPASPVSEGRSDQLSYDGKARHRGVGEVGSTGVDPVTFRFSDGCSAN